MIRRIQASDTWPIRHLVMWPDRLIEFVILDQNEQGLHYGYYSGEELVAVISLFISGDTAQFRKLATKSAYQRRGIASSLIRHIIDICRVQNVSLLWCNARVNKAAYYERFGFVQTDGRFEKGGREYVIMTLNIQFIQSDDNT